MVRRREAAFDSQGFINNGPHGIGELDPFIVNNHFWEFVVRNVMFYKSRDYRGGKY